MQVQYIHKNNRDFVFWLDIQSFAKEYTRVHQFNEFHVKIYTNDIDQYIEAYYKAIGTGQYKNIVPQADTEGNERDFILINAQDLSTLDDGMLKLHIEFRMSTIHFEDHYYNECYDIETQYKLIDKRYSQSHCTACQLIDD